MKAILLTILVSAITLPWQFSDKRKVLVFATDLHDPVLLQQQKILATDPKGLLERDIQVETYILGSSTRPAFDKYKVMDRPFTFLLIGKDGGEKLRSTTAVTTQKLFRLIDQMPMRKREMGQ